MKLIINNREISEPIVNILSRIRDESGGFYFSRFGKETPRDITVQCPWHKDGQESHPSCHVFTADDDPDIIKGTCHCFTCGKAVPFYALVAKCLNISQEEARKWLVENYGTTIYEEIEQINLTFEKKCDKIKKPSVILNESVLDEFNKYHPYMFKRHLTEEVIKKFKIGYDESTDSITFPVWDVKGNLVEITRRSVTGKRFALASNVDKPVYLLNFVRGKYNKVYVAESQLNALSLWSWGYPAIALFGTGTKQQYEILKRSGISNYVLCLDPDGAGRNGAVRFYNGMPEDIFISIKDIPEGKDVNDLTKEEFDNCNTMSYQDWKSKYLQLTNLK